MLKMDLLSIESVKLVTPYTTDEFSPRNATRRAHAMHCYCLN